MNYDILDSIKSISDVKALSRDKVEELCSEIRRFMIEKVGQNGGHLASNLGVVELSVALHRVFDSPHDHIIFDVGHQSYTHKLLTGRREGFDHLRAPGGLSGFTSRKESEHDTFGAGHSSTSISAALGFAESDKLLGKDSYTVAVVGDGAFTGGLVHEAINNCKPDLRMIVVLNENGMSISSNKGTFATYLSDFASKREFRAKNGTHAIRTNGVKSFVKRALFGKNFFEQLGFAYIGVIDGNDPMKVEQALLQAKKLNKCVFVHLKTVKGKGLPEAESAPDKFHSVACDDVDAVTFHSVFADALIDLAGKNNDVVAVTAAMGIGTGLSHFESSFPKRYFDVGIAEGHALTFSAGLAANGLKPFTAIYSTFLQRGYDNIVHDIALQGLPVKMFIDRAGLAVNDGATHHGIFDVAFLSHIPDVEIIAPSSYESLKESVNYAYTTDKPIAVRYPNSGESKEINSHFTHSDNSLGVKFDFDLDNVPKCLYVTYGQITRNVIEAQRMLAQSGVNAGIILVEKIKPFEPAVSFIKRVASADSHVVYVEEGIRNGGAAMITGALISEDPSLRGIRFDIAAINDSFASPTSPCDIYDYVGLSPDKLTGYFRQ